MDDKEKIISSFLEHHNLNRPKQLAKDLEGLFLLLSINEVVNKSMKTRAGELLNEQEATWAITFSMLSRVYEHLESAFIVLFTGAWSSIDVICRVAIESSVNVMYVLESNTKDRVSQYFTHYFSEAERAIKNYVEVPNRDGFKHEKTVKDDEMMRSLESRKKHIISVFENEDIPFGKTGWPSKVFDKFKQIGREKEYREVYATLSSAVHSDASEIVDYIFLKTVAEQVDGLAEMARYEHLLWLRYFIYRTFKFYVDALMMYVMRYKLIDVEEAIRQHVSLLESMLQEVNKELQGVRQSTPQI